MDFEARYVLVNTSEFKADKLAEAYDAIITTESDDDAGKAVDELSTILYGPGSDGAAEEVKPSDDGDNGDEEEESSSSEDDSSDEDDDEEGEEQEAAANGDADMADADEKPEEST